MMANSIIENLRQTRIKKGMLQKTLGHRMGYATATIGHWERGEQTPRLPILQNWCEALGLELKAIDKDQVEGFGWANFG